MLSFFLSGPWLRMNESNMSPFSERTKLGDITFVSPGSFSTSPLRAVQFFPTSAEIEETMRPSTLDIGDPKNIHPTNKQEVFTILAPVLNLTEESFEHIYQKNFVDGKMWSTDARITETGIMVHLVPDEGVDDGPVLATVTVPIEPDDTLDSLAERMHAREHVLLVDTMRSLLAEPSTARG